MATTTPALHPPPTLAKGWRLALTAGGLALLFGAVAWASANLNPYYTRVMNLAGIYVVAATSYNLVNGVSGQFSLGPNGFMAIGGYITTLLMLPLAQKQMVFFLFPLKWPFSAFSFPPSLFVLAVIVGGLCAALISLLVGFPALRLRGDYLAIATFGFGEIVFVLTNNLISFTNGAMGIKGIPEFTNLWWSWGWAAVTVICIQNLVNSSYGRAMKAVREDEIAAEAMGVDVLKVKLLAFSVHAFFAGVAGGLLAALLSTVSPTLFTFMMTFNLLIIVVLGGLGSTTGAAVTAVIFAILQEVLRFVEAPIHIGSWAIPGVSGMRMVVFSALLVLVMLFYRRGLTGGREFTWDGFVAFAGRVAGPLGLGKRGAKG